MLVSGLRHHAAAGALCLGNELAAARDDVLLAGAELAHARAGLRHAADLDPVIDRTAQQRVLARGFQRDEPLNLPGDDVIGAGRQRLGAEAIEGFLRHVAVGMIGLRRHVERKHERRHFEVEGRRSFLEVDLNGSGVDDLGVDADADERAGNL